ncbi:metallophosphoesterase family protein [Mucilaginibacter aquatilis]|uniref:Metallophosphoesterase n=1 Tax=Mucilaginibacter aquatilis TaxID=1517760 RepID=A0A6I4IR13_9SPHI|nr:metallophosphoesterase [Mucilaginibacter aquatilis]MVN92743.1 metallophosphoesterase [Mucilaginibacter aquatilis]
MTEFTTTKHSTPVIKLNQPDDSHKFKSLPAPVGNYPYHLSLTDKVPAVSDQKIVFQMVGDTGSVRNPAFQREVAEEMITQFNEAKSPEDKPLFLFHLGDVVYHHGEAERYYDQFFNPYRNYPAPVFAIAGNHDTDVNAESKTPYQSLDAFKQVFCSAHEHIVPFSNDVKWKSNTQPNTYWTLITPLANIVGLHSNVPKFGIITNEQRAWFIEELKRAGSERPAKAIIICIHHAPYSADINHGSSLAMINFLETAFNETGVKPDIVFSGHVHNYQRFSKTYSDGKEVPFIVAGSGGFDELHAIARVDDERFTNQSEVFKNVKLMNYCDNRHGFLKIAIEKINDQLILSGQYFSLPHKKGEIKEPASLDDEFSLVIK